MMTMDRGDNSKYEYNIINYTIVPLYLYTHDIINKNDVITAETRQRL